MRREPPMLATWLLQRFASDPHLDAIAGDLSEHFHHGRSAVWFWRQVLLAIVIGAWREIRNNKLQAARGAATGWAVLWAFTVSASYLIDQSGLLVWNFTVTHGLDAVRVWWFQDHAQFVLLTGACGALSGWVVARFPPAQKSSRVLAFFASIVAVECALVCAVWFRSYGWVDRYPLGRLLPSLEWGGTLPLAVLPMSILIGA